MEKLTREQAAIIGAYTNVLCGPFGDMHEYIEKIMGRPVWRHELANAKVVEEIAAKAKPDFLSLCHPKEL